MSAVLLVIFLPAELALAERVATITYRVLAVLAILGYLALIQYFNSTLVPLGADLYGYSWKEIKLTVGASGKLNLWTILLMLIFIAGIIYGLLWLGKKIRPGKMAAFVICLLIVATSLLAFASAFTPHLFSVEYDNNLSRNKLDYFFTASWIIFFRKNRKRIFMRIPISVIMEIRQIAVRSLPFIISMNKNTPSCMQTVQKMCSLHF